MRIVGGIWRGRVLESPKGHKVVRPTTDRTREAIASMLLARTGLTLEAKSVLEVFAGSGAIALELLSRGASCATLIERDKGCVQIIRKNITLMGAEEITHVIRADAFQLARRTHLPGAPFDIVVLDPPYDVAADRVAQLIEAWIDTRIVKENAFVVYEYERSNSPLSITKATIVSRSHRGITSVDLIQLGA